MRVALVVTGGVDRSGRERVIPALLSFIERQARRHEVVVYALRYHERPCTYPLLGATVHDLGRPQGLRRQYGTLVHALRRDGRFDVIHGYWALPGGVTAALAGRRLGIPCLVTLDSGEFVSDPEIEYGLQRLRRHRLAVAATLRVAFHGVQATGALVGMYQRAHLFVLSSRTKREALSCSRLPRAACPRWARRSATSPTGRPIAPSPSRLATRARSARP